MPTFKAVYEVENKYESVVAQSPRSNWVAISAGNFVDIIETGSGKCLNRFPVHESERIAKMRLGPNGKFLYLLSTKATKTRSNRSEKAQSHTVTRCELATGKLTAFAANLKDVVFQFVSKDHLYVSSELIINTDRNYAAIPKKTKGIKIREGGGYLWVEDRASQVWRLQPEEFLLPSFRAKKQEVFRVTDSPISLAVD